MPPSRAVASRRQVFLACVALAAAVFVLYGRTARHVFINFDDDTYITENPRVLRGLDAAGVRWAFTTTEESNWHPLTWISLQCDAQLAKALGATASLHAIVHAHNTILHAVNSILLFLALLALTRDLLPALFVSSLFAVHPLHVESVAWAAERKDVLSAMFWMAAMLAWAGYARRPGTGRLALVTALMALGLLAKPMLVTLPFALVLLDIWPLGRHTNARPWRLVAEKVPLFALAAVSSIVTWIVQKRGGAASTLESIPLAARVQNAVIAYVTYLRKAIWPVDLAVFYPHPALLAQGPGMGRTLGAAGAALLLAAITWAGWRLRKVRPWILMGWLWFVGTLVPVIGLVQVGRQSLADRYTYLPLVGIFVMGAWSASRWADENPTRRRRVALAAGGVLLAYSVATWMQRGTWADGETLYRHALRVTKNNFLVHNNLGVMLADKGRTTEATAEYEAALRLKPDYAEAHNNLGVALKRQGKLSDAERHFRATLALRPNFEEAHSNLGNVFQARGEFGAAREQYEAALRIAPDYTEALINYGTLLAREGDLNGAELRLRRAVEIDPGRVEARKNLGIVLVRSGRQEEAASQYEAALALRPAQVDLLSDLGVIRMRQGRLDQAESRLTEAVRIDPSYPPAHAALAELFQRQGRVAEAEAQRREAER